MGALNNALLHYAEAYRRYDGDTRDLLVTAGLPAMAPRVLESSLRGTYKGTVTPEWYRCAFPRLIDTEDYDLMADFTEAVNDWVAEADKIADALEYAVAVMFPEEAVE